MESSPHWAEARQGWPFPTKKEKTPRQTHPSPGSPVMTCPGGSVTRTHGAQFREGNHQPLEQLLWASQGNYGGRGSQISGHSSSHISRLTCLSILSPSSQPRIQSSWNQVSTLTQPTVIWVWGKLLEGKHGHQGPTQRTSFYFFWWRYTISKECLLFIGKDINLRFFMRQENKGLFKWDHLCFE